MGKKKKAKKKEQVHELLSESSSYELGNELTLRDVFERYRLPEMKEKKRKITSIKNATSFQERFAMWWRAEGPEGEKLPVAMIKRKHLQAFRNWLKHEGAKTPTLNNAVGEVRTTLLCAKRNEIIHDAPSLERLFHVPVAPKLYFTDEEMGRLWAATKYAKWPTLDRNQKPLHYSTETAWKLALTLYWHYGFRTQELIKNEKRYRGLQWKNIFPPGQTPNPAGHTECEHGWIRYPPEKQEWCKTEPLTIPLTPITRAAIDILRSEGASEDDSVFNWPLSSVSFYANWHRICERGDVVPRDGAGEKCYKPKHLRKTTTTLIEHHMPGVAQHICGHASDRSGQSIVSAKHYLNAER